jgi:hypothetical protein
VDGFEDIATVLNQQRGQVLVRLVLAHEVTSVNIFDLEKLLLLQSFENSFFYCKQAVLGTHLLFRFSEEWRSERIVFLYLSEFDLNFENKIIVNLRKPSRLVLAHHFRPEIGVHFADVFLFVENSKIKISKGSELADCCLFPVGEVTGAEKFIGEVVEFCSEMGERVTLKVDLQGID